MTFVELIKCFSDQGLIRIIELVTRELDSRKSNGNRRKETHQIRISKEVEDDPGSGIVFVRRFKG